MQHGEKGPAPVGPQLQLLHGILQGHQIPDVERHWVRKLLRRRVCNEQQQRGEGTDLAASCFYGRVAQCGSSTKVDDVDGAPNGLAMLPHIVAVGGLQASVGLLQEIGIAIILASVNQASECHE